MRKSLLTIGFLAGLSLVAQTPGSDPGKIDFVKIPVGEFVMGCSTADNDCVADEKPAHRVQLTNAFEMGKYEVTQAQWKSAMGTEPSAIKGDNHPVESVSKNDVHEFLAKLNARNDGYKYRLPTEAEWEYAARAGSTGPLTGSLDEVAWYADNSGDESHPVGTKKPNAWGLYDMLGNVREWVEDGYGRYTDASQTDPIGAQAGRGGAPDGPGGGRGGRGRGGPKQLGGRGGPGRQLPIMRGGGWDNPASFLRVSSRYHYYGPTLRVSDIGFRVVREAQ